jgi:hypothetical protein
VSSVRAAHVSACLLAGCWSLYGVACTGGWLLNWGVARGV